MKSETRARWASLARSCVVAWGLGAMVWGASTFAHAGPAPTPVGPAAQPAATTRAKVQAQQAEPKAAPPAAPPTTAPAAGDDPLVAGTPNTRQSELYGDRLDALQADVDDLKQKIFRSKTRLGLLKETVLRGVMAGSRIIIAHRNLMGSGFRLVRVVYILDGAQIYARTDETGTLDSEDEVVIFDGNLPPGAHNVTVELTYQGHGFGVFSYLSGYTFESRSSHSFDAPENAAMKLASIGFERGNITTEMKNRPSVSWQEVGLDASGRPLPGARGGSKSKKTGKSK